MTPLASGLDAAIAEEEDLARFLTQSSQYNATAVKQAAFLPHTKSRETSVSRISRHDTTVLWAIGTEVAAKLGRPLYGAAMVTAHDVRRSGLTAESSEPPPRHAAIRGWPWLANDPAMERAQQKERAILLAQAAGAPLLRERS